MSKKSDSERAVNSDVAKMAIQEVILTKEGDGDKFVRIKPIKNKLLKVNKRKTLSTIQKDDFFEAYGFVKS